jgi:hypothetical protein
LNAIVAILATASKAGLIFPFASGISQLKWFWLLQSRRRLRDIQNDDDANRGFSRATILLFTHGALSFASIGAIISILALDFDPFVQQLIHYPIKDTIHNLGTARVKQARIVYNAVLEEGDFEAAINSGIWSKSN